MKIFIFPTTLKLKFQEHFQIFDNFENIIILKKCRIFVQYFNFFLHSGGNFQKLIKDKSYNIQFLKEKKKRVISKLKTECRDIFHDLTFHLIDNSNFILFFFHATSNVTRDSNTNQFDALKYFVKCKIEI